MGTESVTSDGTYGEEEEDHPEDQGEVVQDWKHLVVNPVVSIGGAGWMSIVGGNE